MSALVRRFEATGISAQPLLNRTGIPLGQLTDPDGSVPLPQFGAFLEGAAQVVNASDIWPRRQDAEFSLSFLVQVVRDNFRSRWGASGGSL